MSEVATKELPEHWSMATFGDIADLLRGVSYKKPDASKEPVSGKVPVLRANNIGYGLNFDDLVYVPEQLVKEEQFIKKGDIIIAMSSGSKHLVGKAAQANENFNGAYGAFCANLRVTEGIDPKYVAYFYSSQENLKRISASSKGSNINNLKREHILEAPIPIAPSEQQKRIVAKIEELFSHIDAGIEALKKAKQLLKQYRQSVLKAAVTGELTKEWREANKDVFESVEAILEKTEKPPKPNRWKTRSKEVVSGHPALAVGNPNTPLPEGWKWVPLVEIAKMESGHTPSRRHPEWWDGDIPWIGIVDAREHHCGVIVDTIQHTNEEGLANSASRLLPKGTVCISRTASVGYVVTMGQDMATSQDFVNWVPTPAVTSEWLNLIFIADAEGLRRFGKGSVHKTIYFPEWLSIHIGLPSVKEQFEIAVIVNEKITAMERLESEIDIQLLKAEKNKQSVLASAFQGKV
jgi:type I restriction enzyme S subunit